MLWQDAIHTALNLGNGQPKVISDHTGLLLHDEFCTYLQEQGISFQLCQSIADMLPLSNKSEPQLILTNVEKVPAFICNDRECMSFQFKDLPINGDAHKSLKDYSPKQVIQLLEVVYLTNWHTPVNQRDIDILLAKANRLQSEKKLNDITEQLTKLTEQALQKFIKESNLNFKPTDEAFLEYLADFGAMEWNKEKKQFVPTGFGVLLFGKNPRAKFKNAVLKAHVSYGNQKIEPRDFADALVLLPDQIEEWLKKVLPLSKDTSGFKRKDVPDFPIEVLREAIVNALVHRDYEIEGAKCEIKIDVNKVVVTSPGKPLPAISLEELNTFEAPSLSRNPIITYAFSLMDYVEEKERCSFRSYKICC